MSRAPAGADRSLEWQQWAQQTSGRLRRILVLVSAVFIATEVLARTGVLPALQPLSLTQLVTDMLFAIGFGCPIVLFASALPDRRDVVQSIAAGALCSLALFVASDEPGVPAAVIGFGLGCLAVQAHQSYRGDDASRLYARLFLLPSIMALIYTLQAAVFLNFLAYQLPLTHDAEVYALDGGFGFQPSFAFGQLFAAVPPLTWICFAIYTAPPPILVYVYALQVRAARPPRRDAITALLVLGLSGYAFYFLYPLCGPLFAFDDAFPNRPPLVDAETVGLIAVAPVHAAHMAWRNAMPSLHLGSVLLALWLSRPLGRWPTRVSWVFVVGTALATLGLGEHYAVDLIVALPFTLAAHAVTLGGPVSPERRDAAVASATLVGVWYAVLLTAPARVGQMPVLLWTLSLLTVASVWRLERRLTRRLQEDR
jgi:hypothetical protein